MPQITFGVVPQPRTPCPRFTPVKVCHPLWGLMPYAPTASVCAQGRRLPRPKNTVGNHQHRERTPFATTALRRVLGTRRNRGLDIRVRHEFYNPQLIDFINKWQAGTLTLLFCCRSSTRRTYIVVILCPIRTEVAHLDRNETPVYFPKAITPKYMNPTPIATPTKPRTRKKAMLKPKTTAATFL